MEKLHPKSVWLFFLRFLSTGIVLFIIFGFQVSFFLSRKSLMGSIAIILMIILIYVVFCRFWAGLSYKAYKYQLAEDAFKKEYGVIWKRYTSIPYERIQNVDIHRGVMARILGLSSLMIQTAGFSGHGGRGGFNSEGKLPGISVNKAEELREELVRRAKGNKSGL